MLIIQHLTIVVDNFKIINFRELNRFALECEHQVLSGPNVFHDYSSHQA